MNIDLCQSFQALAALTWRRLEQAEQTGLAWSEETNTETILLELRNRHPANVIVKSFKKHEEALNGADWEWWLGSPGCWLGMRVQAKRIELPKENFRRLQQYKARKSMKRQIDCLIDASRAEQLNPTYCLYVFSRRWPRLGFWPPHPALGYGSPSPSGCLIGHAQSIRAVGSNALSRLASVLLPWHLLVCACNAGRSPSRFANQAYNVLSASAQNGSASPLGRVDEGEEPLLFAPRESLPGYVRLLFETPAVTGDSIENVMRASQAIERRIAGLMLISSEPITG